jgi:hypothetical protein
MYTEIEVDKIELDGFDTVRQEFFSMSGRPAVTFKNGSFTFNVHAIKKFDNCSHIHIYMDYDKWMMMVKPCKEHEKDAVQWSRMDCHGKLKPKAIKGKVFTGHIFYEMYWNFKEKVKLAGALQKSGNEKFLVFQIDK